MMTHRSHASACLLVMLAAACGSKNSDPPAAKAVEAAAPAPVAAAPAPAPAPTPVPAPAPAAPPVATKVLRLGGDGPTSKLEILVPPEFKVVVDDDRNYDDLSADIRSPDLSIKIDPIDVIGSFAEMASYYRPDGATVLRDEKTPDGWIVVASEGGALSVNRGRARLEIVCSATVATPELAERVIALCDTIRRTSKRGRAQ